MPDSVNDMVRLQQDNRHKLVVLIPRKDIERLIKGVMRWHTIRSYDSYLHRLMRSASYEFDDFIEKTYPKYGVSKDAP